MIKSTDLGSTNGDIIDVKRGFTNGGNKWLYPNDSTSEVDGISGNVVQTEYRISKRIFSNSTYVNWASKYIYVAIAEDASAGQFMPTGVLTEDAAGTSMTLTDVTGEWKAGLTAVNETEVTEHAPGADRHRVYF